MKRYSSSDSYRMNDSQDSSDMSFQAAHWDEYPSLGDEPDQEALALYLQKIIDGLPVKQQDVVYLLMSGVIAVDGPIRSWRAAGRALGICHKTVKRRLTSALRTIESELLDSPPWVRQLLLDRIQVDAPEVQPASGLPSFDGFLERVRSGL